MASNSAAHAFTNEKRRFVLILPRRSKGLSMRGNQLWQRIRPLPTRPHVIVIERFDSA